MNALISNSRGGLFKLPPQALDSKSKDDEWIKDNLDALENIGLSQISLNFRKLDDAYRVLDGSFTYNDIAQSSLFLSEVDFIRSQAGVKENIQHYGFIEPLVNKMVMEYMKKPQPFIISASDEMSDSAYVQEKTERLWSKVSQALEQKIKNKALEQGIDPDQEFQSEEQKQAFDQQYQEFFTKNTPEDIEREMNTSWKGVWIKWAEITIKEDYNRFDIDEVDRDMMYDYLAVGQAYKRFKIGFDTYFCERWSPKEVFKSSKNTRYPEEMEFIGRIQYKTSTEIVKAHGSILSQKMIEQITESENYEATRGKGKITSTQTWMEQGGGTLTYTGRPSYINKENLEHIQNLTGIDMGVAGAYTQYQSMFSDEYDANHSFGKGRIMETYWTSLKKMYAVKVDGIIETYTDELLSDYIKENGIKKLTQVSREAFEETKKDNVYIIYYVPEVWEGIKISKSNTKLDEDFYYAKPLDIQIKGFSNEYDTLLPVSGINETTGLVSRLENYQRDYTMALNFARDCMAKELGVFFLMDFNFLPSYIKDLGGDAALTKLLEVVKELGILPVDSSAQNTKGSNFNQFTAVSADLTNSMIAKLNYAALVKQQAFELLGTNSATLGTPLEQTNATGLKQAVAASSAQTELWYDKFSKVQLRGINILLNIAQFAKTNGKDLTVNFVDSDSTRQFLSELDPNITLRNFRVTPEINSKGRAELETLKQTYFQDNTIQKTLEDMAIVISSSSMTRIIQLGRLSRKKAELARQQEQLARQKEIELANTGAQELEAKKHEYKLEEIKLKGEIDLNKQAILSLGFAKDKDVNSNEVADVIDQLNAATTRLKVDYDKRTNENKAEQAKLDSERKFAIERDNQNIERDKINATRYKADKDLQIARENKYSFEVNKKSNEEKKKHNK